MNSHSNGSFCLIEVHIDLLHGCKLQNTQGGKNANLIPLFIK